MTLLQRIAGLKGSISSDAVLVQGSREAMTLEHLLALPTPPVSGLRVAFCIADPVKAIEALVALDGTAEAILLFSSALDVAQLSLLMDKGAADVLLCDDPDTCAQLQGQGIAVAGTPASIPDAVQHPAGRSTEARDTSWILTTSGTTGTPKLVVHSLDSLTHSTKPLQPHGDRPHWGLLYDYTRFAGLQVVLQSLLSGACLVAPDTSGPLEGSLKALAEGGCTHLSATPTLWRMILMNPASASLRFTQVTLGGEIADTRTLGSLEARFPNARVMHIYASTEAGVGFSVKDRRAGFPVSYLETGPGGVALKVEDGRLFLRSTRSSLAYLDATTGNGSGEQGASFARSGGWVDSGDRVEIVDGRVLFLGRESGVINVGGNKIHPEEVEAALLASPLVGSVRVFGKSNPITGAIIVAEVVPAEPTDDAKALTAQIATHARQILGREKSPALINIVDTLIVNSAGKVVRKQ